MYPSNKPIESPTMPGFDQSRAQEIQAVYAHNNRLRKALKLVIVLWVVTMFAGVRYTNIARADAAAYKKAAELCATDSQLYFDVVSRSCAISTKNTFSPDRLKGADRCATFCLERLDQIEPR